VKRSYFFLSVLFILLATHPTVLAQEANGRNFVQDDIEKLLPPLQALIDSAISKNPTVKSREMEVKILEHKLKSERVKWSENVGFQTDVRYGTFNNFSTNTAEGQTPNLLATQTSQMNYGVGAYIKMPLFDFLDYKHMIGAAKAEVEKAAHLTEEQKEVIRLLVIKQYQELILKQRLLKISSKFLETTKINMAMAEKEFQNNVIAVGEFTRLSGIYSSAEADFETAKIEFKTSLMVLEEITKTKFNLGSNN
jgi:outer membrane protein TolC